jgi:hypothetical protein
MDCQEYDGLAQSYTGNVKAAVNLTGRAVKRRLNFTPAGGCKESEVAHVEETIGQHVLQVAEDERFDGEDARCIVRYGDNPNLH